MTWGYVGTEIAKEMPYYAGAFGAALFSEGVSANDALIFLGGANLGAAVYEYGLARLVRAFLERRERNTYASFEADWAPADYLADYYSVVEPDERHTIAFFVDAMREAQSGEPVLYFGVGPTLHHVFLAATKASDIHLGDYLAANLREIEKWVAGDATAHDWRAFVHYTLECEGLSAPTETEVNERETLTRAKIARLLEVDVRRRNPLGECGIGVYGTVTSAYCADSATDDRDLWNTYMNRIIGLVRLEVRGKHGAKVAFVHIRAWKAPAADNVPGRAPQRRRNERAIGIRRTSRLRSAKPPVASHWAIRASFWPVLIGAETP